MTFAALLLLACDPSPPPSCGEGEVRLPDGGCVLDVVDAGPIDCASDAECAGSATPRCDLGRGVCVACRPETEAEDCADPLAPACVEMGGLPPLCGCLFGADCPIDAPVCDASQARCAECTAETAAESCRLARAPACVAGRCGCAADEDCAGASGTRCDTSANEGAGECLSCGDDSDCADPERPVCDASGGGCGACTESSQCERFAERPLCDVASGRCVTCALGAESACSGAQTCDLFTGLCADTPPGSLLTCEECSNDRQCGLEHRCVSTLFRGGSAGYRCLRPVSLGCERPFSTSISARESLNGAAAEAYCGPLEARTTCEAMLALGEPCVETSDCPAGGVCQATGGRQVCNYDCGGLSAQCPDDPDYGICLADNTCGAL